QDALDRAVERPGLDAQLTVGARGDVLDDRVTVPVTVGERDEDVERDRRQRQERLGVVGVVVLCHPMTIYAVNIVSRAGVAHATNCGGGATGGSARRGGEKTLPLVPPQSSRNP